MTSPAGTDSGLLAPTWAGSRAQAETTDEAFLRAMLDVEAALAHAQAELGVVPAAAAATVRDACRAGRVDLGQVAVAARRTGNPVPGLVTALTAVVAARDPEAAEHVHRGATSQDVLDTACMVVARRTLDLIAADLERTAVALVGLVGAHRDTVQAGRTLTQHALPITFGLKAACWLQGVLDALARVRATAAALPAQLGGAAGTLAAYQEYALLADASRPAPAVELAALFAAGVGLAEPLVPWHAVRTPIADLGAVLGLVTGALGKLAVDVLTLSRTEIGEVGEPAAPGRGASSAMPQKRNPVLATLVVSAARQVPALALVLAQAMLAEDERPAGAWHAEWQPLREALRLAGGAAEAAAELAEGLRVHPGRMAENLRLTGGAILTERLNARLAPVLGKAAAKGVLAEAVAEADATGTTVADRLAGLVPPDVLTTLLDPAGYLGAAGTLVERVLRRAGALVPGAAR
ncbi:3-carboxy-cis,cis-muconate cycloisomerase [Saccharothrix sp. NPDC042600]|uniref:3-carboxy-cis,cis-muconate cycloisomerase n=1 Tax=Saccharothrix TaxID=2071 RepID=UPI0033D9DEE7